MRGVGWEWIFRWLGISKKPRTEAAATNTGVKR
jgi:hypothetical protein